MDVSEKTRKPKIGFLFIASRRFRTLGENTKSGNYAQRVSKETSIITLGLADDLEIVNPGDIYDFADLSRALNSFTRQTVDCVLVMFHSWAEDNIWIRFLRDSDPEVPLIYFCPAKHSIPFENCEDEEDLVEFLSSGGLVGSLVGSGSISKMGRTAKFLAGTFEDKKNEIICYAALCKIRNVLHKSKFGILPAYNEIMWNTYIDPYRMFSFGPEVTFISYDEFSEISDKVSTDEIVSWKNELEKRYPVEGSITAEKFEASLRYSIGLWKVMEQFNLDAMTLNDVDMRLFEKIGLRPGFYPNAINESMSVLCPEADLGIALAMYSLKLLTGKQLNTIEPFYIDNSKKIFCAGHAGPNDYNYPESDKYVKISFDARFAKTKYRYAGAPFAWLRIPPGRMTMVHVSQGKNEIKMVASMVDSLEGSHRTNSYAHSDFMPVGSSINDFFEKLFSIGTTQHFVIVQGEYVEQMRDLSSLCGFNFYAV